MAAHEFKVDPQEFADKRVLVTGGAKGIGKAVRFEPNVFRDKMRTLILFRKKSAHLLASIDDNDRQTLARNH